MCKDQGGDIYHQQVMSDVFHILKEDKLSKVSHGEEFHLGKRLTVGCCIEVYELPTGMSEWNLDSIPFDPNLQFVTQ